MALSIKNPHTEALARELATLSGQTITRAVEQSVEERLERLKARRTAPDLLETMLEISSRCSSLPDLDPRSADEILSYDEKGTFEQW